MDDATFVLLAATLKFGVLIGFGVRELVLLRRLRDQDRRDPGPEPAPAPASPSGGVGRKLPDCLIPRPAARPRELERV
jgi:hypothetical protein